MPATAWRTPPISWYSTGACSTTLAAAVCSTRCPAVERHLTRPPRGQRDDPGSAPGATDEVVFQLPLVAVVDQVHAGVDVLVFHLSVVGMSVCPLARVVADEVVGRARQIVKSCELRRGVRAY